MMSALVGAHDLVMVDASRARFFTTFGAMRSPFRGVSGWPLIDEVIHAHSVEVLSAQGNEAWEAAGGQYDDSGRPGCRPVSQIAAAALKNVLRRSEGLLWVDAHGTLWAVRLVPSGHDSELLGYAINWTGPELPPNSTQPGEAGETETLLIARRHLEESGQRLRLYGRAEQLLWAIHVAVVQQRSDVVLLPDIELGRIVWGGDHRGWPRNWRRDLIDTLLSLTKVRSEIIRNPTSGWRPRLGAHSVAVAHVEMLWITHPGNDLCRSPCPLHGQGERHSHFCVQVGLGFLGALEGFASGQLDTGARTYDFQRPTGGNQAEGITEARNKGLLVSGSAPIAILGPAKWSGITRSECRTTQAVIREVTRQRSRSPAQRPDRAWVQQGNRVPALRNGQFAACPHLKASHQYVAFGGNARRAGRGYRLVGEHGTGWVGKAGFLSGNDEWTDQVLRRACRRFLRTLGRLSDLFGLTVVGIGKSGSAIRWFSLKELCGLAATASGWTQLDSIHLRVYGPLDYLDRIRGHFEQADSAAAGNDPPCFIPTPDEDDLAMRIANHGISQSALAEQLGVAQSFVSQLLSGKRAWPPQRRAQVESILAGNE